MERMKERPVVGDLFEVFFREAETDLHFLLSRSVLGHCGGVVGVVGVRWLVWRDVVGVA